MPFFLKPPAFWDNKKIPFYMFCLIGPLSLVYRGLFFVKQCISRSKRPNPAPVICVGNITLGGAGKTPTAIALYTFMHKYYPELEIHFVTRGYGGRSQGPLRVDLKKHTFMEVGDEALLLAKHAVTWVAKKRLKGIQEAAKQGAKLIIMDDGFQNPKIYKDFSLVVIDGKKGLGNEKVFPLGPLRESFESAAKRANFFIVVGQAEKPLLQKLKKIHKGVVETFLEPFKEDIKKLKEKPLVAFAGIGYPEKFFHTLQEEGLSLCETKAFPDHYPYPEKEIQLLLQEATRKKAFCVTTEKDKVRIPLKYQKMIGAVAVQLKGLEENKEFCQSIFRFLKEKNLIKETF